MTELFPRGIATGAAFYDRQEERKKLRSNINHTIHSVLIAPRRFGKTSLMAQVLFENSYSHIWLDLMTITSLKDIQLKLIEKIEELIVKVAPLEDKLKKLLKKYFRKLKPEIILSVPGVSVKLHPLEDTHQGICEALVELDKLAQEIENRIVIVLDEFQEIIQFEESSKALQGSIRHAAERAQATTYLFSGSKHKPLRKLFNGKDNPLYELCDQITLDRISKKEYKEFINKAAITKWGYELNDTIIEKIFTYTDQYPKYVNALCGSLWNSELSPSPELIDELWRSYMFSRKTDIIDGISALTLNQKRLLKTLAFNPTDAPYSKYYLHELNMSQSSVQIALETLLDKGLIVKLERLYRVLDPTIRFYFQTF